ncbi:MAG TPA: radical SAM protein [Verrucomicrobiae bacterium]|nr:radical SAM protein [Verrucomicrobiae bacterium]
MPTEKPTENGNGAPSRVLVFQLDGKVPNIAAMRIAAHHKQRGDSVELRWTGNPERQLWDAPTHVYGSAIFEKSRPSVSKLIEHFPNAVVGGTGVDVASTLEAHGITTTKQDYSIYPNCRQSIGFTQRGCRLRCSFCVVPRKEGAMREENTIHDIWRGEPWPRELILLDNDFFGQPHWRDRIAEIREGGFKVSFNQGINARFLTDEAAEALASIDYRADDMKAKRIYTAWDNRKDEARLFEGLDRLKKYGVKPDHVMVYMLVGFWPGETSEDRLYRVRKLREWGARPYPMPFVRTPELVGFQRWLIGAYDKRFTWEQWEAANYRPENLNAEVNDEN